MNFRAGWVRVELDLGRLGFDQRPDLQSRLRPLADLSKQIGVGGKLDLVEDLNRFAASATGLKVAD
jgi:hypothetical protein